MRLPKPLFYTVLSFLLLCLLISLPACNDGSDGSINIHLTDSIQTRYLSNYAVYWTLEDTAVWQQELALADSIAEDEKQIEIYKENYVFQVQKTDSGFIARQPLNGWKFNYDSTSTRHSIVKLPDGRRAKVVIPASNAVLGGDSVRIGLLRVVDYAFNFHNDTLIQPDYLYVTTWGDDETPLSIEQENIGPVGGQTVFRVGRKYYVLREVAADYSSLMVEEMDAARGMPLTAELDVNYKSVQVKNLEGEITRIKHRPGSDLAIYFFHIRGQLVEGVQRLDSVYKTLPEAERSKLDIALVSRNDYPDSLQAWVNRHDIALPVYQGTGKTCVRLNCNSYLPSFVDVNEKGKIKQFHGRHQALEDHLLRLKN